MQTKKPVRELYLASQSPIRKQLLTEAQIPFSVIPQSADEEKHGISANVDKRVTEIAQAKMAHAEIPSGKTVGETCWVLTADSLVQSHAGTIFGKPNSYEHAVQMLRELRAGPCQVVTGFCCSRFVWDGSMWRVDAEYCQAVAAQVVIDITDDWIATYLEKHPYALQTAGVLVVEGYGAQFVKTVHGSYTTVMGLPLYELRCALEKLSFFGLHR